MSDETQFQNFANLPPQVVNIREGYQRLESKVHRSLRTQQGDATHLAQRSEQVAQFLSAAEQVYPCLSLSAVFLFSLPACRSFLCH